MPNISLAVVYGWNDTVSLVSFGSIPDGLLDPTMCNAIEAVMGTRSAVGFTKKPVVSADPVSYTHLRANETPEQLGSPRLG